MTGLDFEALDWMRSRPPEIHALMRELPPSARVRAREGVELMVPAPGVIGTVNSYFADGTVGVLAPMAEEVTSPITRITLAEGELVSGQCWPAALTIVEFAVVDGVELTREWVATVLGGGEDT